jgi:hypothetical protein
VTDQSSIVFNVIGMTVMRSLIPTRSVIFLQKQSVLNLTSFLHPLPEHLVFVISSANRSGQMVVESLLPGGPAQTCNKIHVGDELVEVSGKEVITMSLGGVRHMIRCVIIADPINSIKI